MNEKTSLSEIEIIENFSFEGYQVVRGEFFSHLFEPSLTFSGNKVYVNMTCIKKMPDFDYIQFLINKEKKTVAIRPCAEELRDSVRWSTSSKKRGPKQITARVFCPMVYSLMHWNPSYRYKLLGKLISADGDLLFIFDLNTPEIYPIRAKEGGDPSKGRTPLYPEEWKDQFGIPFEEHRKITQISIFDNYTVFGMQDASAKKEDEDGTNAAPFDRHEMEPDTDPQEDTAYDR